MQRIQRGWRGALLALALIGAGCTSQPDPGAGQPAAASVSATSSSGTARAASVTLPPAAGKFSYQIGGGYPPAAGVTIVDRDHSEPPAAGRYSICYLNAYQAQPDALAWWTAQHPRLLLRGKAGAVVIDDEWDEALFDISSPSRRAELLSVIGGWIDHCAAAGYRAVEADNLDSYTRSDGLLSAANALAFGRALAQRAHHDGLAIGQKNAAELSMQARQAGFDFAIAEECQAYSECESYSAVYGNELIEIEYTDQPARLFNAACASRGRSVSVVLRDRNVTPAGDSAHVERWC
ncbi:MAG: endo alpha-1,4 polygalactosaminidase [Jatrophihabitantaceae bacterium]